MKPGNKLSKMVYSTSLKDFIDLISTVTVQHSPNGILVPLIEQQLADMDTPVSIFTQIKNNPALKDAFILESVDNETQSGRFSFIGFNPFLKLLIEKQHYKISVNNAKFKFLETAVKDEKQPLNALKTILSSITIVNPPEVPRLISGAVGYLGYDTIRFVEKIPFSVKQDQNLPLGILGFYNTLIIFDNLHKTLMYVYAPLVTEADNIKEIYQIAKKELSGLVKICSQKSVDPFSPNKKKINWISNMESGEYQEMVKKAKEYIKAGDIFQVVLSQRFQSKFRGNPFHLYRSLRIINPSPYLYYIDFGDIKIIGSSPELLVRINDSDIYTRPIAGTRPRGKNIDEDLNYEKELIADEKELAEHLMLVDLGRNDLGRVCTYGSVHVSRMMAVEKYSHVMHIVSDVAGKIESGISPVDALYAAFPAGTLSGAPKIRAMEIIDELEPTERSIYGGAVGYFDFGGNMDWCIAIRTIVLNQNKLTIQAGAGIVADSIAENELQETMNKSQALKTAVEWVATK